MKQCIYEIGEVIGAFDVVSQGLYYEFTCEMHLKDNGIRRLYAVSGFTSHYLGIPDSQGMLRKKLARKLFPQGVSCLVSTRMGRDDRMPWRGVLDGVVVDDGLLFVEGSELLLSLAPDEALRFPAWAEYFIEETYHNQRRMLVRLTPEGKIPAGEIENRRDRDEKDENFVCRTDPVPAVDLDSAAGQCPGDEGQGG